MKRFLTILHQEIKGVHQAAYILGFFAFLSQILALFRDRLLASSFGAGSTLDLYYASFRLPDLIFVSVASMVSISVLIPFFSDTSEANSEKNKQFLNSIASAFGVLMIIVCVIGYFVIPRITGFILPGISDPQELDKLISLSRILLLSPLFLGFSNLLASVTQSYKRFFLYALSPIVYNTCIIFGIVYLFPSFGIEGVIYGVVI